MQKASYIETVTSTGGVGSYPLSTQTLDFIQQQVLILQQLGYIGGSKYILKLPDGTSTGVVYIDGELLILSASPKLTSNIKYINVKTEKKDIQADGETFIEARTYRTATLSSTSDVESYDIAKFTTLVSNQALSEKVNQMPQTVLTYLQDILAAKMPILTVEGLTQSQMDKLTTPCVVSCKNSIAISGNTNYGLEVVPTSQTSVKQVLTFSDGRMYNRYFNGVTWSLWKLDQHNLGIEVKIIKSTVWIRHGELPSDVKIIMVRKKRRSSWRRTGGPKAYTPNQGKRVSRSPKLAYVHYKGIVLTTGNTDEWYVPRCVEVNNPQSESNLLNCELGGLCRTMIIQKPNDANGNEVYKMQGIRNRITNTRGKGFQNSGYCQVGVQVVRYNIDGTKSTGGPIAKIKYHLRRKKIKSLNSITGQYTYTYVFYRTFSME